MWLIDETNRTWGSKYPQFKLEGVRDYKQFESDVLNCLKKELKVFPKLKGSYFDELYHSLDKLLWKNDIELIIKDNKIISNKGLILRLPETFKVSKGTDLKFPIYLWELGDKIPLRKAIKCKSWIIQTQDLQDISLDNNISIEDILLLYSVYN